MVTHITKVVTQTPSASYFRNQRDILRPRHGGAEQTKKAGFFVLAEDCPEPSSIARLAIIRNLDPIEDGDLVCFLSSPQPPEIGAPSPSREQVAD